MALRRVTSSLLALSLVSVALPPPAGAQAGIQFVGTTQGCFAATLLACTFGSTATLGGLTWSSTPLALQTDASGFSAAGNNSNGFGTLTLASTPFVYTGQNFFLQVLFGPIGTTNSAGGPANATGSPSPYSAVLRGSVVPGGSNNGITLNFGGAQSQTFAFTTTAPGYVGGNAMLTVYNKSVNAGDPASAISGDLQVIDVTASPEPSSILLVATGLIGVAGAARRKVMRGT